MSLFEQISSDMKAAMKERAKLKLSVLRQLIAAADNDAIAAGKKAEGLNDDEYLKVIKREARKRQDAIGQYEKAGRDELAALEKQELEILSAYLPEQLTREAVEQIVQEVVSEMGADSPGQFGQVMGAVMKMTDGQADGNVVSKLVRESLEQS